MGRKPKIATGKSVEPTFKRFVDTIKFSPAAEEFRKFGKYTDATEGSPAYAKYWNEQKERCEQGYTVGNVKITGEHYFYLNFNKILLVNEKEKTKKEDFPRFYDGDFEFFWFKKIAREGIEEEDFKKLNLLSKIKYFKGGKHLILTKARRKGYSYKNASLAAYNYTFKPGLLTLILAYDTKYLFPNGTMSMAKRYLDFIDKHTAFKKERLDNTKDYVRAGYIKDGIEQGTNSKIMAISLKDDPDKARGKDAELIIFEEGGTFKNLEDCFNSTSPSVTAGAIITGQIIVFGTGGDMEGATLEFSKMFNNPDVYNFLEFTNIWEDGLSDQTIGWFHPAYMNADGFNDVDGNSDIEGAKLHYQKIREHKRTKAKDKRAYTQEIIEFPFTPSEVFSVNNHSIFPTADLLLHLNSLRAGRNVDNKGIKGYLTLNELGHSVFIKNDNLDEVEFPISRSGSTQGCLVIYEQPINNPPHFMYIGGLDPYAQDESQSSDSSGSVFIYKRATLDDLAGDRIVAEYTGRPNGGIKEFNENVRRLLLYYNATLLYENQINNVKEYFQNKNCLYLLADSPTTLKATINTSVRRGKGCHMTAGIKTELEVYIRDWLLELNTDGIPNYKFIYSEYLLTELIYYNTDGNFDRVIALMMCICYKNELTKIIVKKTEEFKIDPFFTKKLFVSNGRKW